MSLTPLQLCLLFSSALFCVGLVTALARSNTILVLLGIESIDAQQAKETLHILLKYQSDIAKAAKELSVDK